MSDDEINKRKADCDYNIDNLKMFIKKQEEIINKRLPGTIRNAQRLRKCFIEELKDVKHTRLYIGSNGGIV
jgi:hypothetical protein